MSARMGRGIALAALLVVGLTGVAWAQSVTVTLDLTGSGSGTVTSSPAGFSCTGSAHTCTASFAVNTAVTLTATPASGLSGCGGGSTPARAAQPTSTARPSPQLRAMAA